MEFTPTEIKVLREALLEYASPEDKQQILVELDSTASESDAVAKEDRGLPEILPEVEATRDLLRFVKTAGGDFASLTKYIRYHYAWPSVKRGLVQSTVEGLMEYGYRWEPGKKEWKPYMSEKKYRALIPIVSELYPDWVNPLTKEVEEVKL